MLESSLGAGRPETQERPEEVWRPIGTGGAGLEGVLELSVTPLHHAFGLRMVGSGEIVKGAQALRKVIPKLRAELRALVRGDVFGDAKAGQPAADKCVGDGLSAGAL